MVRFWPTILILALVLIGCSGRTIEGVWYGTMPFKDSGSCRIALQKGGRFDFMCDGPNRWKGTGRYTFEDDTLTLAFAGVMLEQMMSVPPMTAKVSGDGNKITLAIEDGGTYHWERRPQ